MDTSRHERIRARAGERISSKKMKGDRSIRRRQDDEQDGGDSDERVNDDENDDENDVENDDTQLAKGKGKGKGKGQGKFGPPAPIPGPAGNEQAPSPPPPPPPPSPTPVAPSTVTSSTDISSALPPPSPEASTTTSVIISTSVATDSTTSVQTSFITITQSTVLKLDTIVTTTTSINSFPVLSSLMASDVIVSSSASTGVVASPTIEPLSPPGESDGPRQAISVDPPISPIARNLLIALGVMGAISLLITAAIIVMQRSKKRSSHRVSRRTEPKDNPLQSQSETHYGVTTETTALPQGQSSQTAKSPTGTKRETWTASGLNGQAATGTPMDQSETPVALHKGGKTFSDALNSFMEKARNSSYSYKIGP